MSASAAVTTTLFSLHAQALNILSSVGLNAVSLLSTGGLSAGSFIGTSGSVAAISNVGTVGVTDLLNAAATTGTSTLASSGLYNFQYNGTFAMTTATTVASYLSGLFEEGIYLTGGSAAAISLSSTAAIVTGSQALVQPWFALLGS
jgi:hypothetical protein